MQWRVHRGPRIIMCRSNSLRHVMMAAQACKAGRQARTIKTASERLTRSTEMKDTRFFAYGSLCAKASKSEP